MVRPAHIFYLLLMISALSALLNIALQRKANSENIANQNMLFQKQLDVQNHLNANGALIQKQGLQRAGMNVLSGFGPNMALQSPSPSKSDIVAPQIDSSMAQMIQQQPLIDAQVEKTRAERDEVLSRIPLNQANTSNIIQNTANLLQQHGILVFQNKTQEEQFEKTMQNLFADTEVKQSQKSNIDWDSKLKDLEYQLENASLETRKQIYVATLNDLVSSKELKDEEKRLTMQKINESVANVAYTYAQINRINKLLDAEFDKLKIDKEVAEQQKSFIIAQAAFVRTQDQWYEFQEMLKSLNVSKDAIIEIGKHTPFYKHSPKGKFTKGGVR